MKSWKICSETPLRRDLQSELNEGIKEEKAERRNRRGGDGRKEEMERRQK